MDPLVPFAVPSTVRLADEPGRLPRLEVASPGGAAAVYLHGAHVTAWQPAGSARPVLWMSRRSHFQDDKPIRGGVPLCFPWFGPHPEDRSAPAHGFARLSTWRLAAAADRGASTALTFTLEGADLSPLWPFRFAAGYTVAVGETLETRLDVRNLDDRPFRFEAALHHYFAVSDVRQVAVEGLSGATCIDKVAAGVRAREAAADVRFTGETDRVYQGVESPCAIVDPAWGRRIVIEKSGSRSTVVWNPWTAKARAMPDFGDEEWPFMVCVETANVGEEAIEVPPGGSHAMTARVAVTPLDAARGAARR